MEDYDGQIHDGHNNDGHNHDGTKSEPKQTCTANEVIERSSYRIWKSAILVYCDGGDHA